MAQKRKDQIRVLQTKTCGISKYLDSDARFIKLAPDDTERKDQIRVLQTKTCKNSKHLDSDARFIKLAPDDTEREDQICVLQSCVQRPSQLEKF